LKFPLKSGNIYSTGVIGYMSEKYGGVCMAAEHKVVVYSTPTCPWCVRAKDYLKNAGIEFEEKDVSVDVQAAREMVKISGRMGVPVLDIDGNVVVGFDKNKIDELLGL
jgi:glutaredoxin 3